MHKMVKLTSQQAADVDVQLPWTRRVDSISYPQTELPFNPRKNGILKFKSDGACLRFYYSGVTQLCVCFLSNWEFVISELRLPPELSSASCAARLHCCKTRTQQINCWAANFHKSEHHYHLKKATDLTVMVMNTSDWSICQQWWKIHVCINMWMEDRRSISSWYCAGQSVLPERKNSSPAEIEGIYFFDFLFQWLPKLLSGLFLPSVDGWCCSLQLLLPLHTDNRQSQARRMK